MDYNSRGVRILLTPHYSKKVEDIKFRLRMNDQELMYHLIDNYTFEDSLAPFYIRENLSKRIAKGMNIRLITSIRVLHAYLGHILFRIDSI
jgi:hypothetical protein